MSLVSGALEHRVMRLVCLLPLAVAAAGCTTPWKFHAGKLDVEAGRYEKGLEQLREVSDSRPEAASLRSAFFTERELAVNRLLTEFDAAVENEQFDQALFSIERITAIDPKHPRLAQMNARLRAATVQAQELDRMDACSRDQEPVLGRCIERLRQLLQENPANRRGQALLRRLSVSIQDGLDPTPTPSLKLRESYRKPVSINITSASVQQSFEILRLASGLNYVFDRDVRLDQRMTFSLGKKTVEDVLRVVLTVNQLDQRILDEDTVLIYPNTPAKHAEYREMRVKSFYLKSADPNKVAAMLRSIAKAKDVAVDERIGLIVVRDNADVIKIAERLVAAQDMVDPEVALELEVLEVSVSRLIEMGINWPSGASVSAVGGAGAGQLTAQELRNRSSQLLRFAISDPLISTRLRSNKGDADILANPRIRVRNRQSAKILIGERVPVFTSTSTPNVGTSESVNYLDVGLKLEIEPIISPDNEVTLKVALEVSNILETLTRGNGTQAYRLGTRNTATSLRVRDGETNILAGLIQREERNSNSGLPGLNELPMLSKLFGAAQDNSNRTEIVLLITPRIVRNIDQLGRGLMEFGAGTDAGVGAPQGEGRQLGVAGTGIGVFPAQLANQPSSGSQGSQQQPARLAPSFVAPPVVPASTQ